jgi:endonuclease YncB( thermonuclease family)
LEAAEQLAPETEFTAVEISRAANRSCGGDIFALWPRAPPEADPEPEPQPEPQPESEPEPEPEPEPAPASDVWTVLRVIDGDTVDVRRGATTERIRMIGIDTPERGECGFGPASSELATLVLGEEVKLVAGAGDDRGPYDRLLRYIDIGEIDAGLSLIQQGLAIGGSRTLRSTRLRRVGSRPGPMGRSAICVPQAQRHP